MAKSRAPEETVLCLRRTFNAPPAQVFNAWIDPKVMCLWFARGQGVPPGTVVEIDPRPGGRYVVDVLGKEDGRTYRMNGVYREVMPPTRLSFTWGYDGANFGESVVTIDIRGVEGGASELTLTHTFQDPRVVKDHHDGWLECFQSLETALVG